ncbi:AAA family ATPase [Phytohabitans aurantiacus]|jgi:hypothetical protein|uniref:ATP-binding protein n=1 Tax=Phytohabitans aurantiacus TaxID=3016789 RepID=A0ABQ5QNA7_9ACTN|nr:AAA family ATPase [Phytohabitans aurantiacus]GLH96043.1 ATP-binding protein [Phytohabitans aurantiacus]
MRLAICGTYSSGKTLTAMALSHLTGVPRTRARTMREILPEAAPGKTLEECTAPELIQMIVVRHAERAAHEARLGSTYVSDGCSLQEWIYGAIRVTVGINPNTSVHLGDLESVPRTDEIRFFESVMAQIGSAVRRHVAGAYDAAVHLPNELPLARDGHRPVNERFRQLADQTLLRVLDELRIPYRIIGGSLPERLVRIAEDYGLPRVMGVDEAIAAAHTEYAAQDVRPETERRAA